MLDKTRPMDNMKLSFKLPQVTGTYIAVDTTRGSRFRSFFAKFSWHASILLRMAEQILSSTDACAEALQEDEVATNSLTGGVSPYMPIVFMKRHRDFRSMYEWGEDADQKDLSVWENAFLHFLKKARIFASSSVLFSDLLCQQSF
jgi:hypothetical protein